MTDIEAVTGIYLARLGHCEPEGEAFCRSCGAPEEPVCSYCGTASNRFRVNYGYQVTRPEMLAKLVDTNVSTR